jgi:hypothetical protein
MSHNDIGEAKKNNYSLSKSKLVETNSIVVQLIELGYDKIYSRRVFYYLHPEDIEEALNYMDIENGIIQHRFIKDRNNSNNICYICGEEEKKHLKELNNEIIKNINNNNEEKVENNDIDTKEELEPNNDVDSKEEKEKNNDIDINNNSEEDKNMENDKENIKKDNDANKDSIVNNINKNSLKKLRINEKDLDEIQNNESNKISNQNQNINLNKNNKENNFKIQKQKIKNIPISETIIQVNKSDEIEKKECEVCNEIFVVNRNNKINNCGHAFCSGCWYDFLSVKIKENKLPSIKCLDYNCNEKLTDDFIINLLNKDINLIKKYKKYKLELEIMNNPNKKLCPYPNCDSYLEKKEIREKDATCKNNHSFCFECLKKPHGNLPCNENIDKSILEFAKNNFVKKCPKCGIITEKNNGCNHITCAKCGYQWCWLCNKQYTIYHFNKGKCKGFQFFKPKNDYEIKLMMEGKINFDELSNSQRQLNDSLFTDIENFDVINLRRNNYETMSCKTKLIKFLLFVLFANSFLTIGKVERRNKIFIFFNFIVCALLFIVYFFYSILLNLISLFIIFIFSGYEEFFEENGDFYIKKYMLILLSAFLGQFFLFFRVWEDKLYGAYMHRLTVKYFIFFPCFIMTLLIYFPQQVLFNIFYIPLVYIIDRDFSKLEDAFEGR